MKKKLFRYTKIGSLFGFFVSIILFFLLSITKLNSVSPALPQQRRIKEILKGNLVSNSVNSYPVIDPNDHDGSLSENQRIRSALHKDILKLQQDTYKGHSKNGLQFSNYSIPILKVPPAGGRRLAYGKHQDEESYFAQLRKRGQLERLSSGGERIRTSPKQVVRFPTVLKDKRPEYWTGIYRTYLNLTFYPWESIPICSNFYTRFAPPGSLSPKALASFPSSGNSWLRYLIECSSGIFTGSMYDDKTLMRKGMYGEGVVFDSGMTIVQKTHGYTTRDEMHLPHSERVKKNHMEELNNEAILIIRNPFKALMSHRHLDVGGHTGYAPHAHFIGDGWRNFVLLKINLWKEFYLDWINNSKPSDLCIIFYEDLKSDVPKTLKKVLNYLSLPVDNDRMNCVTSYPRADLKRRDFKRLKSNPFTEELKSKIFEAIDELSDALIKKLNIHMPISEYKSDLNQY